MSVCTKIGSQTRHTFIRTAEKDFPPHRQQRLLEKQLGKHIHKGERNHPWHQLGLRHPNPWPTTCSGPRLARKPALDCQTGGRTSPSRAASGKKTRRVPSVIQKATNKHQEPLLHPELQDHDVAPKATLVRGNTISEPLSSSRLIKQIATQTVWFG